MVLSEFVQLEYAIVEFDLQPLKLLMMLIVLVLLVVASACRGQDIHLLIVILYNYY